ncbi:hypothetical protein HBA55_32720 [Pseudomaricurvus alkylphenolicus]|jgi:hypothetical protein|uniref:hypothetical protein n=1 Tax=Pseudomaricurvus alkylphenolicus TaxID=1306991 RepID=UPI0014227FE2|nr:hypothetical protein [Pseudomaricurvus alkylphenolicus]NIB44404.1 hypothetical protein [Pseudomaricurvus alkylphenolicus]
MKQQLDINARPDVLSRGALELTFKLLRHYNAQLALDVRNQLQGEKVLPNLCSSTKADHFFVTLSAQSIGKVVAALTQLGEEALVNRESDSGRLLVIRSLMKEWMELAEWLIMRVDSPSPALH